MSAADRSTSNRHLSDRHLVLRNHWRRPLGPLGYYWFLTFEELPELHSLVNKCQTLIDFPYYDVTPSESLHLTLDRIAYHDKIPQHQLSSISSAATHACRDIEPFDITVDRLSCFRSAIAFNISPAQPVHDLRGTLRSATLSVASNAQIQVSESNPHITIAYSNSNGIDATEADTAVTEMNTSIREVNLTVAEAAMVLLERRQHSYSWEVISRIPLAGMSRASRSGTYPPIARTSASGEESRN
ncbi:2'-5' RNA ligase family protein [Nocardia sp. CA-119907]|uniref:2'-5' RNA ligase family protein n=1 Tax=Nocardia sp. CA-119907 TaxID=3239973 RepID=UPI003D951338